MSEQVSINQVSPNAPSLITSTCGLFPMSINFNYNEPTSSNLELFNSLIASLFLKQYISTFYIRYCNIFLYKSHH